MYQKLTQFIFLTVFLFTLNVANAAVVTFTGAGDGTTWEDPLNWDTGFVPTAADDVIITNANSVSISTTVVANSLRISLTAQLTIDASGTLNMTIVTANGNMIQLDDNASLINNGSITVEFADGSSIDLNDDSRVTNNGTMNLIDPGEDPINLTDTSEFTNNGTIIGTEGSDAIELGNSTKFYNHGDITLENFSDEGVDLDNSTTFVNTGFLSVTNVSNDLICIDGSGDHFINSGTIILVDPGNVAIELDDGMFTNEPGGVIDISESNDDGILLESGGDFDNYGQINIQLVATSSADDGISLQNSTTFRNFNTININMSGNADANSIFLDESGSTFRNEECAVVNMLSQHRIELDGGANLINEGVLATVYSGTHDNQGNFTNNGQIHAPNGFNILPNALLGSGTVDAAGVVPATAGPTITCPPNLVISVNDDSSPANTGTATATDNCDPLPEIGYNDMDNLNDCNGTTGTITRTWTAMDSQSNSASCDQTITVVDDVDPMVLCQNIAVNLDGTGNVSITAAQVDGGTTDNCSFTLAIDINSFTCSDLGANTVTLTATDPSNNSLSCPATVTVNDAIAPVAVCQDISVDLDENGMASIVPADVDGGTSDNCSFTLSLDDMDFDCGDIPSAMVTLTATDPGNSQHSCTATVTVNDVTPPTVLCMDATVELDGTGNVSITPATIFAGSSDNCGFIGLYPLAQTEFDCGDVGPNIVTLNVFDGNGNDSSCSATVTVEDNQPAIVACNDLSLELDNMGQASIEPTDLFDAANSTDNCGTFDLTGLSQSDFTCVDEGANTITLFVEDAGGNVSTCTGTVTIAEFLQILSVDHTDASCQYTGDGTISIEATAPAGQLHYSVDGGMTWQTSGEFNFLSPGTYDILVEVHGIPSMCVETATETVGIDPNGTGVTWYQDHDDDDYSNGNTLTQCERPNGFKLASELTATSGDCNDFNPNAFPGQTWWKDYDGDGYGDGVSFVNCSQPSGLYPASELISTTGDCDDDDPAVNPGATEICNGIDDDCDGEVDEGTSGGLTFVGNVLFANQAQVDVFSQCYSVIDGNLTVQNSGVMDLSNLVNLTEVTGDVTVKSTGLASMGGLDNLTTIGGFLRIQYNYSLTTLDGLDAVSSVGGYLNIYRNVNLTDCCAIYDLLNSGNIGGSVFIALNDTGCDSVAEVNTDCAGGSPLIAPPSTGPSTAAVSDAFELNVSPNPNDGHFVVSISGTDFPGQLRLMDSTGRVFWSGVSAKGNQSIEIKPESKVPTGLYFLVYTDEEETTSKKVIIK